jgi:hypothetical protein
MRKQANLSLLAGHPMTKPRAIGLIFVLAGLAGVLTWGCQKPEDTGAADPPAPAGEPWFADVTDKVRLDFVHEAGPVGDYFMPQALGSGAALFDYDGDGLPDLYLLQNGGPKSKATNRLYRQLPGGKFELCRGSGLEINGYNMGVAVADVNNDGWPDVLVTQFGGVRLFLNNGDGKTFTEVTKEAGLHAPAWCMSAAFFDFDRDGWLDLVVVCYVDYDPTWPCRTPSGRPEYCAPKTFPGRVCKLFRNLGRQPGQGPRVRFEDVTIRSGLGALPGPGLGVDCADFTGDGWPDIFVANDGQPNRLWVNQKDGTFKEEAARRGLAYNGMGIAEAGMGIALGDVDGDGLFDVVVTHLVEETNTFWRQGPPGWFRDRTAAARLGARGSRGTGFGVVLGDFDQDGALDLAVANGRISRAPAMVNAALGPHWGLYAERNRLFANDGKGGRFRDISTSNPALCGTANVARGLICADVDGDGALDLLVTTVAGRARLYRNIARKRGHWLMVRAVDPALKRDAYGALVRVRAGARRWLRLINPAGSYLCSSDARAHFGLGSADRVDEIEIAWPDGLTEVFPGGAVDRGLVLNRGSGRRRSPEARSDRR